MIRLVERVVVRDIDSGDYTELPVVAATAQLTKAVENKKNGLNTEYKLSFVSAQDLPVLYCRLIVKAILEDGSPCIIGTEERPVRFTVQREHLVSVSATWDD